MDEDDRTSRDEARANDIDATADGGTASAPKGTPLPIAQLRVEAVPTSWVEGSYSYITRPTAALCARRTRDRRSMAWVDFVPPSGLTTRPYTPYQVMTT